MKSALLHYCLNVRKAWFAACLGMAATIAITPNHTMAQGNLLVTPRRIIFENSTRIQELTLANIGKDSAKYFISVMEIRMKEDGSFEHITIPDSGQQFASSHLRIYPRNVSVAPGQSQLVKVQLIRMDGIAPGEYRSHIYIRAVPVEKPLGEKAAAQDPKDISVKLTAVFGLSVPALIRVGENDTKISLSDPSYKVSEDKKHKLSITLHRSGKMSSYGDITVERVGHDGTVIQVGQVKGIAVYTPNTIRRFNIDLDENTDISYKNCKLHISYKTQKDARAQDAFETDLVLP